MNIPSPSDLNIVRKAFVDDCIQKLVDALVKEILPRSGNISIRADLGGYNSISAAEQEQIERAFIESGWYHVILTHDRDHTWKFQLGAPEKVSGTVIASGDGSAADIWHRIRAKRGGKI